MKYVTGIYALDLKCGLQTKGERYAFPLNWEDPPLAESEGSVFGDYGLEQGRKIPRNTEPFCVANHIRAALDLLVEGDFFDAAGLKEVYIDNDQYDEEIFTQVLKLACMPHWTGISKFMHKEYERKWRLWLEARGDKDKFRHYVDKQGLEYIKWKLARQEAVEETHRKTMQEAVEETRRKTIKACLTRFSVDEVAELLGEPREVVQAIADAAEKGTGVK